MPFPQVLQVEREKAKDLPKSHRRARKRPKASGVWWQCIPLESGLCHELNSSAVSSSFSLCVSCLLFSAQYTNAELAEFFLTKAAEQFKIIQVITSKIE